jgi:hypothetical protein
VAVWISQPGAPAGTPSRALDRGRDQRLLNRVLGGVEVAEPAHERAENLLRYLFFGAGEAPVRPGRSCGEPNRTLPAGPSSPSSASAS